MSIIQRNSKIQPYDPFMVCLPLKLVGVLYENCFINQKAFINFVSCVSTYHVPNFEPIGQILLLGVIAEYEKFGIKFSVRAIKSSNLNQMT